jgi:hypothetical protein
MNINSYNTPKQQSKNGTTINAVQATACITHINRGNKKMQHKGFLQKAKMMLAGAKNEVCDEPVLLDVYENYIPQMFLAGGELPNAACKNSANREASGVSIQQENNMSANSIVQTSDGLFEIAITNSTIQKDTNFESLVTKVLHL